MIELPALESLARAKRVLLFGAGGGYDVLGAVPLYAGLRDLGQEVHFGGVSFASLPKLRNCTPEPEHSCLFAVHERAATEDAYCPEAWLARWLRSTHGYDKPVWGISKTGVLPLRAAISALVERFAIDMIVLIDGGVDLLLKGNETSIGTPEEDLASLQAMRGIDGPRQMIMSVGFGVELRDGIAHAQVLERFAELQRSGGYLGAMSLHADTSSGRAYREALTFINNGQQSQRGTHVHETVLAAMDGKFGQTGPDTWVSPLAAMCWFFSLAHVAESHLFLEHLEDTETIWDVTARVRACRKNVAVRERSEIPL